MTGGMSALQGEVEVKVTHDVEAIALANRILIMRDGRIGSEHRVELGSQDRSRGPAREELRANLLIEIGVASGE